jgi:signal transduction histidine kinase
MREAPTRSESTKGAIALAALSATTAAIIWLPRIWVTVLPGVLLLPMLLWLTAHSRPFFAAAGVLVSSLIVALAAIFGIGHFGDVGLPISDRINQAQAAILLMAITACVLAALFAERRESETRLTLRTAQLTEANRRLVVAAERLRQANTFKNEILGIVAHDLRNPISIIMGRAEILEETIASSPREKLVAQIVSIRDAGKHLMNMVNELLADALADAHEINLHHFPVDISSLISEVAEANRPFAEKKRQVFTVASSINLVVAGDHDRLREAFDNLISNAIKYTPLEGRIDLSITREGNKALIRVVDNGQGLTSDDMTRLFGRFQRLSAKPTGGESSTGLGLSIVKRIVELHGGSIVAESPGRGRGTTFTVSVPLSFDALARHGGDTNKNEAGRFGSDGYSDVLVNVSADRRTFNGTILLIEDEIDVRKAVRDLLETKGLNIVTAASGSEALALITFHARPNLIVADYNLSENMNGVECIEALRRAYAWEIPGIVLTGDTRSRVTETTWRHKNIAVVLKPFDSDEFERLVERLFGHPAAA